MISELFRLINGEHYLSVMLILILSCILLGRKVTSERVRQSSLWVTVAACALLTAQNILETYAGADPARSSLRMIMSIAGYCLRPAAVLGFLLAVWPAGTRRWYLWIPAGLNTLLYSTALFTPLTFSFDRDYVLQHGPLGRFVFYVCIMYMILTLYMIHLRFRERRTGDILVIYLCAAGCLGAVILDIFIGSVSVVPAILISSVTFYMFLRTQDIDHDILTRLWNRMTFYEDCRKLKSAVTAVASIDMNGLKQINDELGHEAGDRALKTIGRVLRGMISRKVTAYRVGGDEFMLLFLHCGTAEVEEALNSLQEEVHNVGLSISVGAATRQETQNSLEEMIRNSDVRMYDEKRRYYQLHDRRRIR